VTDDRIVTVGLSPAWDVSCRGQGLDWGGHVELDAQVIRPAGKALNISTALAWMRRPSMAAGLWGRNDVGEMTETLRPLSEFLQVRMTAVEGATRRNITVVDTHHGREMHLRSRSVLASGASLARLTADLKQIVRSGDICVLAGAMPGGSLLERVADLAETCRDLGARVVIDSYGPVLERLVVRGVPWLIAPNVEEFGQLLGRSVQDTPRALVAAARGLLDKVPAMLISRGRKGVVFVTQRGAWKARSRTRGRMLSTVGCGDYLLAGFLVGLSRGAKPQQALATAVKAATARAWGRTETDPWPQADRSIQVAVEPV